MSSGSVKFLFHPTAERLETLRGLSQASNVPVAELLRRMIDYGTTDGALDLILPAMSGSDWGRQRRR